MDIIEKIGLYAEKISPHIIETPLIRAYALEKHVKAKGRIFLKCENLQVTSSFKARGAFAALLENRGGVVTRSSGNFGHALAFAASLLNIPAIIVLSDQISKIKKEAIMKYQPEMYFCATRAQEEQEVDRIAREKGLEKVSPFDHEKVIYGQATLGLEIYHQLKSISHLYCPIGGGGLMGGASLCLKNLNKKIKTVGIEPALANDYFLSRKQGKKVSLPNIDTIADGLRAPSVGDLIYPLLETYVDESLIIKDSEIKKSMKFLYEKMGLIIEPSGAISIAPLFKETFEGDTVCVLTGGNVDLSSFYSWIG